MSKMERKEKLLQYLQKNPGWHTSQELAVEIGSSKRTIKNYISQLNSRNNLIESSVRGYKYNADKLISPSSRTYQNEIPTNKEERVNYIINFLVNNASTVNLYDLSENLFVSETTVLQDLKTVQAKVQRFNMKLKKDGDFWHLIGNERQKRSLLSSLIYEETTGTFMNRSIIQDNFPDIDVTSLRSTILETCSSNNIYLNTFDLNNVLLHFAIVISRLQTGHLMKQNEVTKITDKKVIDTQAYKIVSTIEEECNVNLEEPDRKELTLILQASLNGNNKVEDDISVETKNLVDDLITYVWKTYQIDLNDENFRERFSLHLDRLITRALTNKVEHNPIVSNIKISSPTIYECAVLMAHRIGEKVGIQIEDNEIAYIALHIGNAIAEQMSDRQKLSVLVLMPQYYDNSAVLSNRLQSQFSTYINVKGIISDPSQINQYAPNVDILIVVNSNYVDYNISTVNISQFLLLEDIQKLNIAITTKQHQVKKDKFQESLLSFFDSNNFVKSDKLKNIDAVFDLVSSKLENQKVVQSDFKERLYQREQMSSTAFGRIAIPHSLDMSAQKSKGFIVVNPHGIKWSGGNEVYLVIALAIDPNNKQLFREVFDELSDIVTDINNVTELIKCKNYSEFIIKLVELL